MTEPWQCEVCGRYFTSKKNRIQLMLRVVSVSGSHENFPYLDICTDCESDEKKRRIKRSRNDGST
jgi:transcriptional regulator NrdR family protein